MTITIVDYGVGNLTSIANMLKKAGFASEITGDLDAVRAASKLILPGVGAFDRAATRLRETGLDDAVRERAAAGVPFLGVCLGMQLLLDSSEEGTLPGLGLVPGTVRRLPPVVDGRTMKVPHMGWNTIERSDAGEVLGSVRDGSRFYFLHSYYADPLDPAHRMGVSVHGVPFASMVRNENVAGVQFHPEKSHRAGLALMSDFGRQP